MRERWIFDQMYRLPDNLILKRDGFMIQAIGFQLI